MHTNLLIVSALASAVVLFQPEKGYSQAAVIFDDFLFDNTSMPRDNLPGFPTLPGFFEWTVTDGSVDLVGTSIVDPPGDLFGRYVDLGGSTNDPGLFAYALPVSFLPNVIYTLSFFYNSVDGAANTATVRFGDQTFNVSSSTTEFATFTQNFTFPAAITFPGALSAAPSQSPLTFQDLDSDNAGVGVDRIMVTPAVPEPTAVTLLVLTALGVNLRGRRAKQFN